MEFVLLIYLQILVTNLKENVKHQKERTDFGIYRVNFHSVSLQLGEQIGPGKLSGKPDEMLGSKLVVD